MQLATAGRSSRARPAAPAVAALAARLDSASIAVGLCEGAAAAVTILAAAASGVPYVLLDASQPLPRLRSLCAALPLDAPRVLLQAGDSAAEEVAAQLGWDRRHWLRLRLSLDDERSMVAVEPVADDDGIRTNSILPREIGGILAHSDIDVPVWMQPAARDRVCHYYFTSGTTGMPKTVVCTYGNMRTYVAAHAAAHGYTAASRVLLASAPTFDPFAGEVLTAQFVGCTLCVWPREQLLVDLDAVLRESAATHVMATPSLWSLVQRPASEFTNLQALMLGGEKMSRRIIAEWAPHVALYNMYGVTEATVYQLSARLTPSGSSSCIGTTFTPTDLLLVDEHDTARVVEPGQTGELLMAGPLVARYADAKLDAERFATRADGRRWYRTGDMVRQLPDGSLEYAGRRDLQVKIRGQRVEIVEIEDALLARPLIQQVAVVFASNERLCAHLVCTAECRPAGSARLPHETVLGVIEAVALARARALLPPAWLPTHVAIESQPLPCTPSGKLDRKLLASRSDKAIAGASGACNGEVVKDDPVVAGPPTTPFQTLYHTIRRLWEELLAVRHIQPDDNFMQLGADSLNAMRACTRLKATLQPPTSEDAEVGRRTGYLGGVFSVEALASSPSLKAYAATVANAMSVPLTDAEAAFVEAELPATAAATAAGHVVPTAREALLLAAEHNWVAAAQTLLEAPPGGGCTRLADVNGGWTRSSPIFTPLHAAARGGGVETLKVLLKSGATFTAVTSSRQCPAHFAAMHSTDCLRLLLEAGTPPLVRDDRKQTLCHAAARAGNISALPLLEAASPSLLTLLDRWNRSPLHWAIVNGHVEVAMSLLERNVPAHYVIPPSIRSRHTHLVYEQPLHLAARVLPERVGLLRVLLERGARVNAVSDDGETPLHSLAGCLANAEVYRRLALPAATNVTAVGAALAPLAASLDLLLQHATSGDVLRADNRGRTALDRAVACGNILIAERLARYSTAGSADGAKAVADAFSNLRLGHD